MDEMQKVYDMEDQITLSSNFLAEVRWWFGLLAEWNGVSLIYEDQWTTNADFNLWTDASGTGFGAYWDSAYLLGEFSDWARSQSITFKELYAIVAAVATWGPSWGGKKICIYCNNKSVCQILQHWNSWSSPVAALLQTLYHLSVKFGCLVSAMHLPGVDNTWADCLSRGWLEKFYAICPAAAPFPTVIRNFVLDFSDEADSRTQSSHCDLATSITSRLNEEGFDDSLDRGLDLWLMAFEQQWILLTVVERNVGKAQCRK